MGRVDVVLIGRNEGDRLVAALAAADGHARRIVYVDSGSSDGSIAAAQRAGATVVKLDPSRPFTAARARNEGFAALDDPQFVQFIDGDCAVLDGCLEVARSHLTAHPRTGLVTGWLSEVNRDASIYNRLCDVEWHRPAGEIDVCNGFMMVRAEAFRDAGGFNADLVAGEDDEFSMRLRTAGWKLERLPIEMAHHDAAIFTFGQWWKRAVRAGHAYAQVGRLHPGYFLQQRRRAVVYGLMIPVVVMVGLLRARPVAIAALAAYPFNWARTARGLVREHDITTSEARRLAVLLTISKFPNLQGIGTYYWRRVRDRSPQIIEYKGPRPEVAISRPRTS